MGLHLLKGLNIKLTHPMILDSNSQAVIKVLNNQCSHPGQFLLDNIIQTTEGLHKRQDTHINCMERAEILAEGDTWQRKLKGIVDIQVH